MPATLISHRKLIVVMGSVSGIIQVFSGEVAHQATTSIQAGYIVGIIAAFLILCYLIYSLIKPEKF